MQKQSTPRCSSRSKAGRYKVKNWSQYNQSLINRGNITLWFSADAQLMYDPEDKPKKQGGQLQYTDTYIEMCCMIRKLYSLGLRQTQGTVASIVKMLNIEAGVPSYSQICRRMKKLKINPELKRRHKNGETIHVAFDSTGLKVYGEGEWKVRQHGWGKHRTWRKVHLGVDADANEVLCQALTTNSVDDAAMVEPLFEKIPSRIKSRIKQTSADGAYDKQKVYQPLDRLKIKPLIPPRKGAKIIKHGNCRGKPHPRDVNLRYIRKHGKAKWKRMSRYHKRNKSETAMFRIKTIFSDKLQSRTIERQEVEVAITCKMLNRMTRMGMPITEKIMQKAA
ncbi:MAG: IS5 family transposase [Bacteroidetes bacterium]|nr:MAG: IS5 family transposase [Bacteroidota bacterium]